MKVIHSSETHLCQWDKAEPLEPGDLVVVPSRYGKDLGKVLGRVCCPAAREKNGAKIFRKASEQDLEKFEENKERERQAMQQCNERISAHGLDMKLVSAHILLEESKILFFFTAEQRVDFRALVRDLVSVFKTRVELRQIGVRDEARVLGGVAVCGRSYCCHGLTDKLKPVSIKMAKEQNLSLNSMKISGPCGRLLCCLSYEFDFYREEKRKLPAEGSRLRHGGESWKVMEVNILAKNVKLSAQDGRYMDIPFNRFTRKDGAGEWIIETVE